MTERTRVQQTFFRVGQVVGWLVLVPLLVAAIVAVVLGGWWLAAAVIARLV